MSDNTVLNIGAGGDTIATDDIGGVKFQRIKLIHGADGVNDGDVSSANPLPVGGALLTSIAGAIKAEDSAGASGDNGVVMLMQRRDSDASAVDTDGDYATLKGDEEGRLKVSSKPASYPAVTGSITASAQSVSADVSRASNVMFYVTGTFAGHNVTFEGSIDAGTSWFGIQVVRSNANTIETTSGALGAAPAYAWEASVNGLTNVRVRATAHSSGTANWRITLGTYATEPIPAAQISGTQPVSGTVTTTLGNPTNASIINSAASTNGTVIKASAGNLYGITASNNGAGVAWVKLHNSTTVTVGSTAVAQWFAVPAGGSIREDWGPLGARFSTGICLSITGAVADADTTAVAAGQVKVITSFI